MEFQSWFQPFKLKPHFWSRSSNIFAATDQNRAAWTRNSTLPTSGTMILHDGDGPCLHFNASWLREILLLIPWFDPWVDPWWIPTVKAVELVAAPTSRAVVKPTLVNDFWDTAAAGWWCTVGMHQRMLSKQGMLLLMIRSSWFRFWLSKRRITNEGRSVEGGT